MHENASAAARGTHGNNIDFDRGMLDPGGAGLINLSSSR